MEPEITRRKAIQTLTVGGITISLSGCQFEFNGEIGDSSRSDTPNHSAMQDRHGPMRAGRFSVTIDDVETSGFRHVKIPGTSTEVEQQQGSQLWGQTTYDDLEMERGFIAGDAVIRDWRDSVIEGRVDEGRKEIAVTLMDEEGEPQVEWQFVDAWIKEYDPPELDANADEEVATEAVTIAFDQMIREEM